VGRAAELATLEGGLERAARGAGNLVLIGGEAGIGKSLLVQQTLDRAHGRGFQVLLGTAEELDRRPFAVLAAAAGVDRHVTDSARTEINRLLTGDDIGSPLLEFRIGETLLALVEDLCVRAPVALGVEDLHWADPASMSTLWRLSRQVHHLPLLIVGTYRPVPSPDIGRLVSSLGDAGTHMVLGALSSGLMLELATALLGAELGPNLARRVNGAAGNPLFVRELLDALVSEDGICIDDQGRAEVEARSLPLSLPRTILRRLNDMPAETFHVLQLASVLGASFPLAELVQLTGRPTSALLADLRPALTAGVLHDAGPRLAFRHELVRDALYEALPEAVRRGLHSDLAGVLVATGGPATRVAEHLLRGLMPVDREAVAWIRRAAKDASRRAPAVAAELLGRALAVTDRMDPDHDQLQAERAESLLWSGQPALTEAICRRLLARGTDAGTDAHLLQLLMSSLFNQSRNAEARQEAEAAARVPGITAAQRAILVASGSWARLLLGDLEGAAGEARRALDLAERSGSQPAAICRGLQTLAVHDRLRGRHREGLHHADEAIRAAGLSPDRAAHRLPLHLWRGLLLMELDRFEECQRTLATGRLLAEELGSVSNLPNYHFAAGSAHWWSGAWDDAVAECRAGLELAEEVGGGWRLGAYGMLSLVALHRDDMAEAERLLTAAEDHMERSGPQPQHHLVRWPRALVLEARGEADAAHRLLAETWDGSAAGGAWGMCLVLGPDLTRLALALGDRARAESVSAAVEAVAEANGSEGLRGTAQLCRGLIAHAPELLGASSQSFARARRPFDQARACELAGDVSADAGRIDDARGHLQTAIELYEVLRAGRPAARAERSLRQLGLRRGRRGPRGRPKMGWASLTDTESRVTGLVAEGLSNPEVAQRMFLSRRTVQTHMSHILAKLELSSRIELAAAVARRRN